MQAHIKSIEKQPIFTTQRLNLSALTLSDADAIYAYGKNPNVSRYTVWETHQSVKDAIEFINYVLARKSQNGLVDYTWGLRLSETKELIGALDFNQKSVERAEIHYTLAEEHWGKGYTTEAVKAVIDWAFSNFPDLLCIASVALTINRGSTKVMEKCGLKFVRISMAKWAKYEEQQEEAWYELMRSDWSNTRNI